MTWMSQIPPQLAAEMTPAVRAFVDTLFARIDERDAASMHSNHHSARPRRTPRGHRCLIIGTPKPRPSRSRPSHLMCV